MAVNLYAVASASRMRVIVGSRRWTTFTVSRYPTSLLATFVIRTAAAVNLVDLDTEAYADPDALQRWLSGRRRTCREHGLTACAPRARPTPSWFTTEATCLATATATLVRPGIDCRGDRRRAVSRGRAWGS
jgi:hypothetical protein